MNDTAPQGAAPVKVRMDRSRAYGEIHGDRGPDDKYRAVFFTQDGLRFDAQGFLLADHPDHLVGGPAGDKLRELIERKLKKAASLAAKQPAPRSASEGGGDDESEDQDSDGGEDQLLEPINLEAWLRGEQQVEWQEVTQEISRRYKRRISKIDDAIPFLVSEGVVPKGQLARKFQKYAD